MPVTPIRREYDALERAAITMGKALAGVAAAVQDAFWRLEEVLNAYFGDAPEGYYWRDGRIRRDHSYFRQRARDRRAALRAVRR